MYIRIKLLLRAIGRLNQQD